MPRIKANSISQHIAEQEAAVFAAAVRLFSERGYDNVTLADIAAEVGLARNSLYRYFPDKAHILVRWFEQELPRQVERSRELLAGPEPVRERIERWALATLDYADTPEHALAAELETLVPELDQQTRRQLADSHAQLNAPLDEALKEAGVESPIRTRDDRRSDDALHRRCGADQGACRSRQAGRQGSPAAGAERAAAASDCRGLMRSARAATSEPA